ncbi:MAG: riboflavin synthase subunit alpha [Acidobacteria bacterium RIFCSPLOWO2_12_FULL_65_11]|nr:MAG: riboflavin synthase subunit alpha [Acidobacteria bacterium RIFCSPLOWO2_02_FULL_64_15]OFW33738.1 MAG: riboflavin synthase subunit alpha [Acidobacteria bacterium RIFCSPLOWO2_12_FULL_65_11]
MFTGLVEAVGELVERKQTSGGFRLRVQSPLAGELSAGESVAVNGVCLTVILANDREIHAEVGPETIRVTTLGSIARGSLVNLERPLRADGRIGGHFVQGHADAVGHVEELRAEAEFHWLTVSFPLLLAPFIVHKGSIAVDGVSLTVAGLGSDRFDVQLVPYTMTHTNFHRTQIRDRVNLECDVVGKYVVRAAELAGLTLARVRPGEVAH